MAKYPTYENLMEGQIASAGAHQAKLIEKFKKNNKYIKNQFLALKIVFGFLFLFLPIFSLITFFQTQDSIDAGTHSMNSIVFISSITFTLFIGIVILYMLMFGMISTSAFMSGNAFKWLHTLPLTKHSLKKIGFMTIFRSMDVPLILLASGFPIITLIATQDIFIFLVSIVISVLNVIFGFSILVIVGQKMSFLFSESKGKSKRASLIRLITMLGYFIIMFSSSLIFSWGISAIDSLFEVFATVEPDLILSIILSLIPFFCAPAFLISMTTIQFQIHPILILTTLTGFALSIILTWVLFKFAQNAIKSAISAEIKIEKEKKKEAKFELKKTSKMFAYVRKDIVSSTRDIQSFMFIFFPIFYPLILVFTMQTPILLEVTSTGGLLVLWSILLAVYLFIPPMLVVGFLNLEESGSSILASLPVSPRDQAKAKIFLMISIQGVSLALTSIVLTIILNTGIVLLLLLVTLPIAWSFLFFMFEMKIKLFGQMKYKYIIEELNKENKILKWIVMILSELGLYFTILIVGSALLFIFGIDITIVVFGIFGIMLLGILIFVFTRMFPKEEKSDDYVTGGFLREHVNAGTASLLLLYFIFLFFVIPLVGFIFLPLILNLPLLGALFIDFFVNMGVLSLLWLVIVPLGLKLPKKESFKSYVQTIGLSSKKSLGRNTLLGIGTIVIFGASSVLFATLLGKYTFKPLILFSQPGIFGFGWFLLVIMLIPGIWEELALRGVILNLQLKKYSQNASIVLNGLIFGLFHLVNLLAGAGYYNTFMQVIYASCLGFAFAYMYVKTKSLIPSIIAHYLIDSVGQLFLFVSFPNFLNRTLFLIFGIGIMPMLGTIVLVKLIARSFPQEILSLK
ncbi:MAG: CPBP family intramembrane glutamic endopeptidase [Promethearchaeota archaeon]